jgi:TonB family protein
MSVGRIFLFLVAPLLLLASTGFSGEKETLPIKEKRTLSEVIYQSLPPYTEAAKKAGIEGVVVLEAVITAEGKVKDVKVLRGLGYGLDESAVQAVTEHWRFKPATNNGQPIDTKVSIEILFNDLDKKRPAPEPEPVDIYSLKFEGNKAFTEEQLRVALEQKPEIIAEIGKDGVQEVVTELYQTRGYITITSRWLPGNVLCICEGKQLRIGRLEIRDAKVFPVDTLLAVLELKSGDLVDFTKIRAGLQKIAEMYGSVGLRNFNCIPEQTFRDDEGEMDIIFTFNESN